MDKNMLDTSSKKDGMNYYFCKESGKDESKCPVVTKKTSWIDESASLENIISVAAKSIIADKKINTDSDKMFVVEFQFDSAKMYLDSETIIKSKVKELNDKYIVVKGFTDNIGGSKRNQELANARAVEVKKILVGSGVKEEKIKIESYPLCCYLNDNSNKVMRKKNRRVEIHVTQEKE